MKLLKCEMFESCQDEVTHIDDNGFIYCKICGDRRKLYRPCRKLTVKELETLKNGEQIKRY